MHVDSKPEASSREGQRKLLLLKGRNSHKLLGYKNPLFLESGSRSWHQFSSRSAVAGSILSVAIKDKLSGKSAVPVKCAKLWG
jgi:hypothetical protein